MKNKKISAVGIAVLTAETKRKNFTVKSITRKAKKIKNVPPKIKKCTDFLELNQYQKITVKAVYNHSKSVSELVEELAKLNFCDVQTALRLLVAMEYITKSDGDYLIGENVEIRRK